MFSSQSQYFAAFLINFSINSAMNFNHRTRQGEPGTVHGKHKGHGGPASLTTRRCPGAGLGTAGTDGRRRALYPTPSTKRLSLGRPHRRGVAFPASDPPQGSVGFTRGSPSDPLSRGYLVSPRLLRMGEAPRLTSNCKSGTASASRGGLWYSHARPGAQGPAPFTAAWQRTAAL